MISRRIRTVGCLQWSTTWWRSWLSFVGACSPQHSHKDRWPSSGRKLPQKSTGATSMSGFSFLYILMKWTSAPILFGLRKGTRLVKFTTPAVPQVSVDIFKRTLLNLAKPGKWLSKCHCVAYICSLYFLDNIHISFGMSSAVSELCEFVCCMCVHVHRCLNCRKSIHQKINIGFCGNTRTSFRLLIFFVFNSFSLPPPRRLFFHHCLSVR